MTVSFNACDGIEGENPNSTGTVKREFYQIWTNPKLFMKDFKCQMSLTTLEPFVNIGVSFANYCKIFKNHTFIAHWHIQTYPVTCAS